MDALDEILSFVNRFPDAEDEAIDLLLDQFEHESSCTYYQFIIFSFFYVI